MGQNACLYAWRRRIRNKLKDVPKAFYTDHWGVLTPKGVGYYYYGNWGKTWYGRLPEVQLYQDINGYFHKLNHGFINSDQTLPQDSWYYGDIAEYEKKLPIP